MRVSPCSDHARTAIASLPRWLHAGKLVVDLCAVDLRHLLGSLGKQLHLPDLLAHVGWCYIVTLKAKVSSKEHHMHMQNMVAVLLTTGAYLSKSGF